MGDVAICKRCDSILARSLQIEARTGLALVIACAALFAIANLNPILSIQIAGSETDANVWYAVRSLETGWISVAAAGLAFTTFLVPAVQIVLLFWVLAFVCAGMRPPFFKRVMVLLHRLRPWSMSEIFLLGALVAIVKLANWVPITAGAGLWALAALITILAILGRCDPSSWWALADERKQ
jgi:paraquat-inducible protein A